MGQGFALSLLDENQTKSNPQGQPMTINEIQANLSSYFADIPDPRVSRTQKHLLKDLLAIAILAVIGGAEGWEDMENYGIAKQDKRQERVTSLQLSMITIPR